MIDVAPVLYVIPPSSVEEEPPELAATLPDNETCLDDAAEYVPDAVVPT